jgi:hypothetical protein
MASINTVIWWLLGGAVLIFVGIIPLSGNPAGPVVAFAGFIALLIGCYLFTRISGKENGERK